MLKKLRLHLLKMVEIKIPRCEMRFDWKLKVVYMAEILICWSDIHSIFSFLCPAGKRQFLCTYRYNIFKALKALCIGCINYLDWY